MTRFLRLGISAVVLMTAATSLAKVTWDLQPSGTGTYDWTLRQHWFFDEQGATDAYGGGCTAMAPCSFHSLANVVSWGGPGMAAPECLELTTYPGNPWDTPNPDTVIEVSDQNNAWQMVNDDYGGTWQSHARVWIEPIRTTMTAKLRVRAYSSAHNSDDFYVGITRRDLTKSQCTSGQSTIPWVQITDSPSFNVTLSTNH